MISIIIPTYNREAIIGYTLDSLSADKHPGVELEIIVIDDGSTDNVRDVIKNKYPHVLLVNNIGKGAPAARNTGLGMAKGEFVLYLDSDDLVGPGFFKNKVVVMHGEKSIDACYGEYDFFESDAEFSTDNIIFKYKYPVVASGNAEKVHLINYLGGNYLPPNSILWRTDFLRKLKGHDESLIVNQDVELTMRALFNGLKLKAEVDGTKVYIRSHALDSRVGTALNSIPKLQSMVALRRRIYSKYIIGHDNEQELREALSLFLFNLWRKVRHIDKAVANECLQLSKEVRWPVPIKGNILFRTMGALLGPVKAVEVKYFLFKRD